MWEKLGQVHTILEYVFMIFQLWSNVSTKWEADGFLKIKTDFIP